jgi:hypothetical protein
MSSSDISASAKTETNDTVFEEDKHSYNSMVIGLVTKFSTPRGGLNIALVPTLCIGTSREWNVAPGPCSAIAELGIFSHIIFNGFWTCVVAFHSLRWPQYSVGADTSNWHLQGMKCCTKTLFCHSQIRHFFSWNLQWILDLFFCIPFLEVAST